MRQKKNKQQGFTLLEILIALFIFTIVSMLFVGGLHTVMNADSGTETSAARLRELQMTMLLFSRDIEQTVNRPVILASSRQEAAFVGTDHSFSFTHMGLANPIGSLMRSALQRTEYRWQDNALLRVTWQAVDQAPESKSDQRKLMSGITDLRFDYLDKDNRFREAWPMEGQAEQVLPKAVRIRFNISPWGSMSQLYVIAAQNQSTAKEEKAPDAEES